MCPNQIIKQYNTEMHYILIPELYAVGFYVFSVSFNRLRYDYMLDCTIVLWTTWICPLT